MKKLSDGFYATLIAVLATHAWSRHRRRRRPSLGPADMRSLGAALRPKVSPTSQLKELSFGLEGAKKSRHKRTRARLGAVALIATLLGIPGINLGLELLDGRFSSQAPLTRSDLAGVTTSEAAGGLMKLRGKLFQSRPTPSPTPTEEPEPEADPAPSPAPAGSVTEIIYSAAAEFGIDAGYLVSVASCESNLNPGAVNPAGYHGLFQFDSTTWAAYGYGSIYDPVAQARTAARMLAAGMASRWPNCA